MAQRNTQTREYWVEDFSVEQADIEYLYNVMLEHEAPLSIDEMALVLVRYRVSRESTQPQALPPSGDFYHPTQVYEAGARLIFPSMGGAVGEVTNVRQGDNPDYGEYRVLQVSFGPGREAEFASGLDAGYLIEPEAQPEPEADKPTLPPEELFIEYGGLVGEALEKSLASSPDLVRLAGRWFPKSLLANVNSGHLNLAEAILDMNGGGPLETREIVDQVGMLQGINVRLAEFSLNYGLQQDARFDEVGPAGKVLWFLTRMEPAGVQSPPERLQYTPISSDPTLLTDELRQLEAEIGDEHSDLPAPLHGSEPQSVTVTLIYPHQRSGTLPLSPQLRLLFPTAYQSPRIRFILVDAHTGEEIPAWVVRPGGYVYGLGDLFARDAVPVGSYLRIARTEDPGRVQIDVGQRRPRKEWVRSAFVEGNRLRFTSVQRPVGSEYDELMVIDVPDPDAIDALWRRQTERKVPLEQLMGEIMRELASINPQGHIHARTLYSAVNLVRRCPPGPIFARLVALPEFEHVGGGYWRLNDEKIES